MKHGRTKARRERADTLARCLRTILTVEGPDASLEWLAAHIGALAHDLDELRRDMRRAGRDTSDTPAKRRKRAAKRRAEAYEPYRTNTLDRSPYGYQYVDSDGKPVDPIGPTTPSGRKR